MGFFDIIRFGKPAKSDAVFKAWNSSDLRLMMREINTPTNPIDRHFLLQEIVRLSYQDRSSPESRHICRTVAEKHVQEIASLLPAVIKDGNFVPRVSTFQYYATLLTEDREFARAIEVCQQAISLGLDDGTQGGYLGRIEKIKKKTKGS